MMISLISGQIPQSTVAIVDAALRSLLVAAAVWAGLRMVRLHNVMAQKAAWGLVLAGALSMPVLAPWAARQAWLPSGATMLPPVRTWWHSAHTDSPAPKAAYTASRTNANAGAAESQTNAQSEVSSTDTLGTAPWGDRFPAPVISSSHVESATHPVKIASWFTGMNLFSAIEILYLMVCGLLMLRLQFGLGSALMLWLQSEPVSIDAAPEWAAGLRVRSSHAITSPVTVGSGIVLPSDYTEWDIEKLHIVLAHERSHVRQGDFYLQIFAGVYAALFWFSPLGWWLKRKLSDLSEAISDRAGLVEAASRVSYAQILLEFAALPRTTQIGVAMARPGSLTHRIDRLLNDSSFSQAFAGGRRRIFVAVMLVPVALFAATALIRVEAAGQEPQAPTVPAPSTAPVAPTQESVPASPSNVAPVAPVAPEPPEPMVSDQPGDTVIVGKDHSLTVSNSQSNSNIDVARGSSYSAKGHGYSYSYDSNGNSYAVIKGDGKQHVQFSGDWGNGTRARLDKARRMAHGDFLWFTRDDKAYILEDQATVAKIEEMYKPMEELSRQQEELGKQQEALGKRQEELGRRQEQASIPTPDIAKEMADLNNTVAKLQAKKGSTVTQDQLADLESKLGELQGKLGSLQGEIGAKQGELGAEQGKLGAEQGKLGAQQGRLGAEEGRIAQETDRKVKSIIDASLRNGSAKPVE